MCTIPNGSIRVCTGIIRYHYGTLRYQLINAVLSKWHYPPPPLHLSMGGATQFFLGIPYVFFYQSGDAATEPHPKKKG
jgi:hypothetical protein